MATCKECKQKKESYLKSSTDGIICHDCLANKIASNGLKPDTVESTKENHAKKEPKRTKKEE